MSATTDRLVWIDLEMSGLDPNRERILEIATIVTDGELRVIDEGPEIVIHQPDPILDNFAHDVYRYRTPEAILQEWKSEQYTHVVVYERGLDFMIESASRKFTPAMQETLQETVSRLSLFSQTPDKVYSIYEIP